MPPKKVPKYEKAALESLSRSEIIATAREERDGGAPIGALSASSAVLITSLMKIKKTSVVEPDVGAGATDVDDEVARLAKALEAAKLRQKAAQDTTGPKHSGRPRLEEPSKLSDSPTEEEFEVWMLELNQWMATYKEDYEERYMAQATLKVLAPSTKKLVFKLIPQGEMTVARILQGLTNAYAGDVTMRAHATVAEYRACKRAGGHLKDHLLNWRRLRTEAMATGLLKEQDADAFDLLSSCGLSTQQRQIVNGQFSQSEKQAKASGDLTWNALSAMIAELKNLGQAFAAGDMNEKHGPRGNRKKHQDGETAMFSEQTGKGSTGGGGTGNRKVACATCGKEHRGVCWLKGKGSNKSNKSNKPGGKGKSKGKGKGKTGETDWKCPCGWLVFGRSQAKFCPKCGKVRAGDNADGA